MATVDLSQLPVPDVLEVVDFETTLAARKAKFVSLFPADQQAEVAATVAIESEPSTVLLQENAYREITIRQRINDAGRARMLAFAQKADLDHLAADVDLVRLVVTPADDTASPPVAAVMEDDESLRERVQEAYESMSVAGPRKAYIGHARAADGRIADVSAISPAPCEAVITVLGREGDGAVDEDVLDNVRAALNDEDVRPIGDRVTVQSATIVPYAIDATIYTASAGPERELILAAATQRVEAYRAKQRRLGRDINRSAVNNAIFAEGVTRVDLRSPAADIELDETQAGHCTGVTLVDGGARE